MNERVQRATDSYIDDIVVNEDIVSVESVMSLLTQFGLEFKDPQNVISNRVLGLGIDESDDQDICWHRDGLAHNEFKIVENPLTKHE